MLAFFRDVVNLVSLERMGLLRISINRDIFCSLLLIIYVPSSSISCKRKRTYSLNIWLPTFIEQGKADGNLGGNAIIVFPISPIAASWIGSNR